VTLALVIALTAIVFLELLHRRERDDWRIERQRLLTLRFENRDTTPVVISVRRSARSGSRRTTTRPTTKL
jgi:hypothetical protein